jgi:SPP1 family predicted phage head-tail adaptor
MIGSLRHRITFQQRVLAADGGGGFTETWQNVAASPEVYASIEALSGGEGLQSGQLSTSVSARFVVRHRTDITPNMRIQKGSAVYNIVSVSDKDGSGTFLDILAIVTHP